MTQNTVPLPEPAPYVVTRMYGNCSTDQTYFTADQMHAYAAKVCAEKDAEIERLRGRQSQMTTEQVVIIARVMADIQAAACNVDVTDNWAIYGEEFLSDARVIADELNRAALKESKT